MTRAAMVHVWLDVSFTALLWGSLAIAWLMVALRRDRRR